MQRAFEPGYFGKLPLAADFLSRHAGDAEAFALERWLQEAVALARLRFGPAADGKLRDFLPHRFVFWTKDPEAFLVGVLAPGRDRAGRRFPFAVFLQNRAPKFRTLAPTFPAAFAPFLAEAGRIARTEDGSPPDLQAALLAAAGRAPGPGDAGAFSAEEILERRTVGGIEAAFPGSVGRGLEGLRQLALRSSQAGRPPAYGLRFPIPVDGDGTRDAAVFWMAATRRVFRQVQEPGIAFWTAPAADEAAGSVSGPSAGGPGRLDLYFRTPEPAAFLHLVDVAHASDLLLELVPDGPDAAARGRSLEAAPSPAVTPTMRLSEALDLL